MEHATVPIPTDLEPDQEAMLKELREGQRRLKLSPVCRSSERRSSLLVYGEFPIDEREREREGSVGVGCTQVVARFRYLRKKCHSIAQLSGCGVPVGYTKAQVCPNIHLVEKEAG